MKKILLTAVVAFSTLVASAQFMVVTTYDGDQEEKNGCLDCPESLNEYKAQEIPNMPPYCTNLCSGFTASITRNDLITGTTPEDYGMSGLNYLKNLHLKVSLLFNRLKHNGENSSIRIIK